MSSLQRLWGGTRDDIVRIGKASRPKIPGGTPKLAAQENKRATLKRLDRNGPKQMSEAGYERVQTLLQAMQARPAGSAKRLRKEQKATAAKALRKKIEV